LLAAGLSGDTRSVDGLFDGSTWPSFYTGRNPAGHGFIWLDQLKSGTYRTQACRVRDFARCPALWDILGKAGRRSLVLDVPLARLSPRLRGVQIVEWGCHDAIFQFQTTPARLKRQLLRDVGLHPSQEPCDAEHRSVADFQDLVSRLSQGIAAKARFTQRLLVEESWDFAIQVFSEAHCGGHQLWHFHDRTHPAFDPGLSEAVGDPMRQLYRALDAAIGDILSVLSPETRVVFLDLHGMTAPAGMNLLLPEILIGLGVMSPGARWQAQEQPARHKEAPRGSLRAVYRRLPEWLRRPLYEARQNLNQRLGRGTPMGLSRMRSQCFDVPIGASWGAIRLNLQGREPQGLLTSGAEADRFTERLIEDLLAITEPETGRPLIRRVLRTSELFSGPYEEELPDLLLEWNPENRVGSAVVGNGAGALLRARSPKFGRLEALHTNCRTGEHRVEGLFIARGPGVRPGRMDRVISSLDLAPSFARFLGCEMPDVDGRVIPELS
jgi:predicted AlkP superfamily phosphohydrolase/phosphomutase